MLEAHRPGTVVRSELEQRFLELCRSHGIPEPQTNVQIPLAGRRFELDCVWPDMGVVVELDGARPQHSPRLRDRPARDTALVAAGLTPLRYTWKRPNTDERRVPAELEAVPATARPLAATA